jgi:hypothetical protein
MPAVSTLNVIGDWRRRGRSERPKTSGTRRRLRQKIFNVIQFFFSISVKKS